MNFALGMLFCVSAMAYTFIFVPDSRPIRDARIAKMALNSNAATEKPIEGEEVNSEYSSKRSMICLEPLKPLNLLLVQKIRIVAATFSKAYSTSKICEMPGEACSKSVKVIKDFLSFFSSWPLNWKSF